MESDKSCPEFREKQLNIPSYNMVYCGIMKATTIKIYESTKSELDTFREYKNESYDEVIKKVVYIAKNVKEEPELSIETIEAIEKARERMKKGKFLTEEEARKKLGL
jgi:flagellar motor component MotA